MPSQHKPLPSDDEEVIPVSQPDTVHEDIAAGVELPQEPLKPEREMNEWERAGVRPPQAYRH